MNDNTANAPSALKLRSMSALMRQLQALTPGVDNARASLQEYNDVVAIYGDVTDEDLAPLGITAAQAGASVDFLTQFFAFMDASSQGQPSYRSQINAIKRIGAQI
jgi:hypothetical protein